MNNANATRDKLNGQFGHAMERACTCGHRKGIHDAERARSEDGRPYQPCQEDGCDCQAFQAVSL